MLTLMSEWHSSMGCWYSGACAELAGRLNSTSIAPVGGGSVLLSPAARRRNTTSVQRSRELLLVARNAREHLREKEALSIRLQQTSVRSHQPRRRARVFQQLPLSTSVAVRQPWHVHSSDV